MAVVLGWQLFFSSGLYHANSQGFPSGPMLAAGVGLAPCEYNVVFWQVALPVTLILRVSLGCVLLAVCVCMFR